MDIFGPKPWFNPFGKMSIFGLYEFLVFIAQKGDFSFQNNVKDFFLAYIGLKKKTIGKMTIFGLKRWVNPFGKMSAFRPFGSFCFYSLERRFFILEYRKRHFPGLYWLNKKCEKWPILDQSHGLTPLEKCQFFNFLKFLFLQPRRAFFRCRIS